MPSFVPPQVDHNLYTPILPQDNVMQIFSLLDQKQQLYNQGVKSAQNKVSSMLNLENEVTSEPIKEMVTDFNGKANNLVKEYANLDFSLQGNIALIDNIYDPLLNNSLFLADYSATKHNSTEIKKVLDYRDSNDEKTRNMFSQTNLDLLNIKRQNLAGAKTEREIKAYSSDLLNTNYTPYYNVQGELMEYINKMGKEYFDVKRDFENNWTIVTKINGKEQQYPSLQTFVKSFLSDKANTQLEIESQVGFYNELRNSGISKEQFLSNQINDSRDQYQGYTNKLKEHIENLKNEISTYPEESKLNDAQREDVEAYKAAIESATLKLTNNEKTLNNLNEYMEKAEKGEVEYSRFYDAAENLYVKNVVENKINDFANGLVKPESIEIKKNDAYATMIQEKRLSRQLENDILAKEKELNLKAQELEQTKVLKMLELGYAALDENGNIIITNPAAAESDTWMEPSEGPTTVTPTDIASVNGEIDKVLTEQVQNTYAASTKVLNAFASVNDTPLTVEESNWLETTIKNQGSKTIGQIIKEAGPNAAIILKKAGLTNNAEALRREVSRIVGNAEGYISNTTLEQAGNKAGYYNQLATVLDDYNEKSMINTLQTENVTKAVKKSLEKFEQKYPEYTGIFQIDANGKIVQKYSFYRHNGMTGLLNEKDASGKFRKIKDIPRGDNRAGGYRVPIELDDGGVDVKQFFENFLKTPDGSVGAIGNYFKKVLASDAGTFKWLRDSKNRQVYLNPNSYQLTTDEYTDSKYYGTGIISGGEWRITDSEEANLYNEIVARYFNSIDDVRYKLPNKNEMVYGRRVETKKGVTTIYPTAEYLKYIFGAGTIADKSMDKDPIVDEESTAFSKLVKNISKYGINVKTPGQSDEVSLNMLSYIKAGNTIPIKKTLGGRSMTFKIMENTTTGTPVLEGSFSNSSDIFLDEELTYRFDNNTVTNYSNSPAFSYYKTDLNPGTVDTPLIRTAKKSADTQLKFNNLRQNSTFVSGLQTYLQKYKRPSDEINGADILSYMSTLK